MQQENRDNSTGIQVDAKGHSKVIVAKTINIFESSQPPRGIPFQALALPKDYVDRPEIRQKIKSKLIDCSQSRPGTLVVSAIYGLGGVGKSVMAAALAHDKDVQAVCVDGVLWVTLGQNPDLKFCLSAWVQALGDYDSELTIDSASSHLRSLLRDKKMLLVVDDAWNYDHVAPFQVGGEGCRVLVTTREAHVPDADRIYMDVMSEPEALKLLLSKSQVESLMVEDDQLARKLIAVVGGLPLALDLAGAQIADGMSWNKLLEDLAAEIAILESLDQPNYEEVRNEQNRKRLSLKASLNLSLKLLNIEQLQQFAWLGVLPEDVAIQQDMAATLWSIPPGKALKVLQKFRAKALLLSGVQKSSYRIHDLMLDLARGVLTGKKDTEIPGLDLQWPLAHGILLDRYHLQTTDNLWHTLPDDGYIYSHLTWHMEKAGRLNELHGLFQEVTKEGRNGWYERCDFLGQNAKFFTDLGRAWKLAEKMYEEDVSSSISLQVRYALILSTLNSLVSNIPAELMAVLVKNKRWSPAQGLAYAQQAKESGKRSAIVRELASYLPKNLLSDALDIVGGIKNESDRATALSGLAPYLLENLLLDALDMVCGIKNESDRATALSGLAPYLPKNLFSEALDIVRGILNQLYRTNALNGLAPHIPVNLLSEALEVACGMHESARAIVLSGLAPYLPKNLFSEALDIARGILNKSYRTNALTGLAPHIPVNLLSEALEIARGMHPESDRAKVLTGLVPHLPENLLLEALDMVNVIRTESGRTNTLSGLAPHLPENLLSEVLDMVNVIRTESGRTNALSGLAPHLPESLLLEALDMVRVIQNESDRANALNGLAPHLPENLLSKALDIVRGIRNESGRTNVLSGLAPHLPENLLSEALDIVREIRNESGRTNALSGLAPHLPENLLSEVLDIVGGIQDKSYRAKVLKGLKCDLPKSLLLEELYAARGIRDEFAQATALSGLAPYLPENLLSEVLDMVRGIKNESFQANALSGLVPHLPKNLLSEVLDMVREIRNGSSQANMLIEFNGTEISSIRIPA